MTSTTIFCEHCGRPIRPVWEMALDGAGRWVEVPVWWHTDGTGMAARGCRTASWVMGPGWDLSLDKRWMAEPGVHAILRKINKGG